MNDWAPKIGGNPEKFVKSKVAIVGRELDKIVKTGSELLYILFMFTKIWGLKAYLPKKTENVERIWKVQMRPSTFDFLGEYITMWT